MAPSLVRLAWALAAARAALLPRAPPLQVAGPVDEPIPLELRATLQLPDGAEAALPVDAGPRGVGVDGDGAPRVARVASGAAAGAYGAGQNLTVSVVFTAPVEVVGDPSALALRLATGCASGGCSRREEQSFVCKADSGSFALELYEGGAEKAAAAIDRAGAELPVDAGVGIMDEVQGRLLIFCGARIGVCSGREQSLKDL